MLKKVPLICEHIAYYNIIPPLKDGLYAINPICLMSRSHLHIELSRKSHKFNFHKMMHQVVPQGTIVP